jgi:hypothetical protein
MVLQLTRIRGLPNAVQVIQDHSNCGLGCGSGRQIDSSQGSLGREVIKSANMSSRSKREVRGALFLSLGVGAICFFISLFILLLVGIFTGLMPLDIFPNFKKPIGWWEIGTLLVSFALSALVSESVFSYCKKYISQGRLRS